MTPGTKPGPERATGSTYEIWELERGAGRKRILHLRHTARTAGEARRVVEALVEAGLARDSIVVQETQRHRWFKRLGRQGRLPGRGRGHLS